MKRFFLLTAALVLLATTALFTSCRYKDLCYDHHHDEDYNFVLELRLDLDLKLDLELDVDITDENHTKIEIPSHMVVCFYDTASGALKQLSYVETYGGPMQVTPGTYDMLVYSFDTEWTQITGENNINKLEAYTSDITAMKSSLLARVVKKDTTQAPEPIIYTPDHLLVTRQRVEIPQFSEEKRVITVEATVSTIVETYNFVIPNIVGLDYVASVDAFITNQARANYFGRGELCPDPATIYFPVEVNKGDTTLATAFNTFGKLPGESKSYLNIVVTNTEGKPITHITDITEQFRDTNRTIIITDTIVIPVPSESGGIAPTVEEWEEEQFDIPIG